MITTSPCRGCPDRRVPCHATCGRFQAWQEKAKAALEAEAKARREYYGTEYGRRQGFTRKLKDMQKKARG